MSYTKNQRNHLKSLRESEKSNYIHDKLNSATSTKDTYSVLNNLLHKSRNQLLPSHSDPGELAERFSSYFTDKIATVRANLVQAAPGTTSNISEVAALQFPLNNFQLTDHAEIAKLIMKSPSKSCVLDPAPTWLIKKCPAVIPLICNIVNESLTNQTMPATLKLAHVIPALKKPSLDNNELKNYRPISNLAFTSKIIERAVSRRLEDHCAKNNIDTYYQSAYKRNHSTESALVRVQNDLLMAVDRLGGAILVLLDLSAAFDTIDHSILLNTLRSNFGVSGPALEWFNSYLCNRQQAVRIGDVTSKDRPLSFGVPQGSVLGPQLFSIYTQPL
jgi:hypothetical protein